MLHWIYIQKKEGKSMSQTEKEKSSKKLLAAAVVLIAIIAVFAAAYVNFRPKAQAGAKAITLTVVDNQGKETAYEARTDKEYLGEVFDEIDGLTVEGTESTYGLYIETVNGLAADYDTDGAYWSLYVNGEYGSNSADSQPITDGDAYTIKYEISQ
jgi:flagellar biosynthesis/type III secretory pathway M-ring protein FliF/YscJ